MKLMNKLIEHCLNDTLYKYAQLRIHGILDFRTFQLDF